MIVCPKCGKENQDHYKFCLGCGAELPRDGAKPFGAPQPAAPAPQPMAPMPGPSSPPVHPLAATAVPVPQASAGPAPAPFGVAGPSAVAAPAAPAAMPAGGSPCPQCGHLNAGGNVFCGSCGFRLGGAAASPSAAPPQAAPAPGPAGGTTVTLTALRADGSEAGSYTLPSVNFTLGRDTGGIFAGDSYLSPKHATFRGVAGKVAVKDEGSLNGVYRKLTRDVPVDLQPGDVFRIGQEIVRFEALQPLPPSPDGVERLGSPSKGYVGRIALVIGRDTTGNAFPIPETGVHLGRERGDVLFPEDGYVSGLHCHIGKSGNKITITDLGSSNGTFVRLREEATLQNGDVLLMGQQLFRVTLT